MNTVNQRHAAGRVGLLAGVTAIGLAAMAPVAAGAADIDADADRVLREMSTYLAKLPSYRVEADVDQEVLLRDGQKLQISSSAEALVEQPGRLYLHRHGAFADMALYFDGKTLTLSGENLNVYAQIEAPGSINDAIRTLETETGLDMPGADLLFTSAYPVLLEGVTAGRYMGTTFVGGVECHYLAFREDDLDWQLWVRVGDSPLPMKYVITSKWMTAAPQYSIRFHNWDTQPKVDAARFTFTAPADAVRLDTVPVSATGEFMLGEDSQ